MWSLILVGLINADPQAFEVPASPQGVLVAIGGGVSTSEIIDRTTQIAGGRSAKVAIIAEANPDYGPASVDMWKRAQVAKVDLIDVQNPDEAKTTLDAASLIWLPGGLQGSFMARLRGSGIEDIIRRRYHDGAVIAGTSAGAAVMSKTMIGGRSNLDSLKAGTAPYLVNGLGLWPNVIVDQHFLQKGRFNRLALAVIDYPELLGIGIDEETAVIVRGRQFEVIGENNVTVIDARKASRETLAKGESAAARNLKVHVLRAGMKFDFDE